VAVVVAKWEEEEQEVMIPTNRKFTHQTMMVAAVILRLPWAPPLPAFTHGMVQAWVAHFVTPVRLTSHESKTTQKAQIT
jgi:hypothetical protein